MPRLPNLKTEIQCKNHSEIKLKKGTIYMTVQLITCCLNVILNDFIYKLHYITDLLNFSLKHYRAGFLGMFRWSLKLNKATYNSVR